MRSQRNGGSGSGLCAKQTVASEWRPLIWSPYTRGYSRRGGTHPLHVYFIRSGYPEPGTHRARYAQPPCSRSLPHTHRRSFRMATINMPKKESAETAAPPASQARVALGRFRLQVDRQTKAAFTSLADAEKAGRDIKKAHPIVQVSV